MARKTRSSGRGWRVSCRANCFFTFFPPCGSAGAPRRPPSVSSRESFVCLAVENGISTSLSAFNSTSVPVSGVAVPKLIYPRSTIVGQVTSTSILIHQIDKGYGPRQRDQSTNRSTFKDWEALFSLCATSAASAIALIQQVEPPT